jgi:hypothetical protein
MNHHPAEFDPVEDALERSPWCVLVATGYPDDPDIIGPFASYEEAQIWSLAYPRSAIRKMASAEFVALQRRELDEIEASKRPHN